MKDMKWFFPDTLTEVDELLKNGYKAHGGGTFLVKTALNTDGLFDLSRIPQLKEFGISGGYISLGSALTYTKAAAVLESESAGNFMSKALSSAAACPLRNRITLGGSIYAAPKWSDLIGPLLASDASVRLSSSDKPSAVSDYLSDKKLRHSGIITEVIIPEANIAGGYYRFTQTHFDYPMFTITVSMRGNEDLSCCITGPASGPLVLKGKRAELLKSATALPDFNKERSLSGEYIKKRAEIEFVRLLNITGGNKNE
ncbi:MAG: FAD binding domain-containing protein [Spirochaetales bacterium]|nr:FAD binding domain-containing protein [Spirochaetales bacterium]